VPFWIDAVSNIGVIAAFVWWRSRPSRSGNLPAEHFMSAIALGFRYAQNNRNLRATLIRAASFFLFASAYWALLPNVARYQVAGGPELYGAMLGGIGVGAVAGAFSLPTLKAKLGTDHLVQFGQVVTAIALVLLGVAREPVIALAACVIAGIGWIAVLANLNVSAQVALPEWVRGRGLAMFVTVFFGTMTIGSVLWGELARIGGISAVHFIAAAGTLLVIPITHHWKLQTTAGIDLSPSMHWPAPVTSAPVEGDAGPVLVTIEYRVAPENGDAFLEAVYDLGRERKRDGACAWGIFRDTADDKRYIETFFVGSWLEHLRQHTRVTKADQLIQDRVRKLLQGEPVATHAIHAGPSPPANQA
jgi:hypothetical protein